VIAVSSQRLVFRSLSKACCELASEWPFPSSTRATTSSHTSNRAIGGSRSKQPTTATQGMAAAFRYVAERIAAATMATTQWTHSSPCTSALASCSAFLSNAQWGGQRSTSGRTANTQGSLRCMACDLTEGAVA